MDVLPDGEDIRANMIITHVDNARFRVRLAQSLRYPYKESKYNSMLYSLDMGNIRNTGQLILVTLFVEERKIEREDFEKVGKLKNIIDFFLIWMPMIPLL